MASRFAILALAGAVIWIAASCDAQAQVKPPGPGGVLQTTPKPDYSALPQGDELVSQGVTYVILDGVRAASGLNLPTATTVGGGQVMERKGSFVIYRETQPVLKGARPMVADEVVDGQLLSTHAVVLNRRTGGVGVLIGRIVARLKDVSQADAIASTYNMTVASSLPDIGMVFYVLAPGENLMTGVAALRSDPRVSSADPEILEHVHSFR